VNVFCAFVTELDEQIGYGSGAANEVGGHERPTPIFDKIFVLTQHPLAVLYDEADSLISAEP